MTAEKSKEKLHKEQATSYAQKDSGHSDNGDDDDNKQEDEEDQLNQIYQELLDYQKNWESSSQSASAGTPETQVGLEKMSTSMSMGQNSSYSGNNDDNHATVFPWRSSSRPFFKANLSSYAKPTASNKPPTQEDVEDQLNQIYQESLDYQKNWESSSQSASAGTLARDQHVSQSAGDALREGFQWKMPKWQQFRRDGRNEQVFSEDQLAALLVKSKGGNARVKSDAIFSIVQDIHGVSRHLEVIPALFWTILHGEAQQVSGLSKNFLSADLELQKDAMSGRRSSAAMNLNNAVEELLKVTEALLNAEKEAPNIASEVEKDKTISAYETWEKDKAEALHKTKDDIINDVKPVVIKGLRRAAKFLDRAAHEIHEIIQSGMLNLLPMKAQNQTKWSVAMLGGLSTHLQEITPDGKSFKQKFANLKTTIKQALKNASVKLREGPGLVEVFSLKPRKKPVAEGSSEKNVEAKATRLVDGIEKWLGRRVQKATLLGSAFVNLVEKKSNVVGRRAVGDSSHKHTVGIGGSPRIAREALIAAAFHIVMLELLNEIHILRDGATQLTSCATQAKKAKKEQGAEVTQTLQELKVKAQQMLDFTKSAKTQADSKTLKDHMDQALELVPEASQDVVKNRWDEYVPRIKKGARSVRFIANILESAAQEAQAEEPDLHEIIAKTAQELIDIDRAEESIKFTTTLLTGISADLPGVSYGLHARDWRLAKGIALYIHTQREPYLKILHDTKATEQARADAESALLEIDEAWHDEVQLNFKSADDAHVVVLTKMVEMAVADAELDRLPVPGTPEELLAEFDKFADYITKWGEKRLSKRIAQGIFYRAIEDAVGLLKSMLMMNPVRKLFTILITLVKTLADWRAKENLPRSIMPDDDLFDDTEKKFAQRFRSKLAFRVVNIFMPNIGKDAIAFGALGYGFYTKKDYRANFIKHLISNYKKDLFFEVAFGGATSGVKSGIRLTKAAANIKGRHKLLHDMRRLQEEKHQELLELQEFLKQLHQLDEGVDKLDEQLEVGTPINGETHQATLEEPTSPLWAERPKIDSGLRDLSNDATSIIDTIHSLQKDKHGEQHEQLLDGIDALTALGGRVTESEEKTRFYKNLKNILERISILEKEASNNGIFSSAIYTLNNALRSAYQQLQNATTDDALDLVSNDLEDILYTHAQEWGPFKIFSYDVTTLADSIVLDIEADSILLDMGLNKHAEMAIVAYQEKRDKLLEYRNAIQDPIWKEQCDELIHIYNTCISLASYFPKLRALEQQSPTIFAYIKARMEGISNKLKALSGADDRAPGDAGTFSRLSQGASAPAEKSRIKTETLNSDEDASGQRVTNNSPRLSMVRSRIRGVKRKPQDMSSNVPIVGEEVGNDNSKKAIFPPVVTGLKIISSNTNLDGQLIEKSLKVSIDREISRLEQYKKSKREQFDASLHTEEITKIENTIKIYKFVSLFIIWMPRLHELKLMGQFENAKEFNDLIKGVLTSISTNSSAPIDLEDAATKLEAAYQIVAHVHINTRTHFASKAHQLFIEAVEKEHASLQFSREELYKKLIESRLAQITGENDAEKLRSLEIILAWGNESKRIADIPKDKVTQDAVVSYMNTHYENSMPAENFLQQNIKYSYIDDKGNKKYNFIGLMDYISGGDNSIINSRADIQIQRPAAISEEMWQKLKELRQKLKQKHGEQIAPYDLMEKIIAHRASVTPSPNKVGAQQEARLGAMRLLQKDGKNIWNNRIPSDADDKALMEIANRVYDSEAEGYSKSTASELFLMEATYFYVSRRMPAEGPTKDFYDPNRPILSLKNIYDFYDQKFDPKYTMGLADIKKRSEFQSDREYYDQFIQYNTTANEEARSFITKETTSVNLTDLSLPPQWVYSYKFSAKASNKISANTSTPLGALNDYLAKDPNGVVRFIKTASGKKYIFSTLFDKTVFKKISDDTFDLYYRGKNTDPTQKNSSGRSFLDLIEYTHTDIDISYELTDFTPIYNIKEASLLNGWVKKSIAKLAPSPIYEMKEYLNAEWYPSISLQAILERDQTASFKNQSAELKEAYYGEKAYWQKILDNNVPFAEMIRKLYVDKGYEPEIDDWIFDALDVVVTLFTMGIPIAKVSKAGVEAGKLALTAGRAQNLTGLALRNKVFKAVRPYIKDAAKIAGKEMAEFVFAPFSGTDKLIGLRKQEKIPNIVGGAALNNYSRNIAKTIKPKWGINTLPGPAKNHEGIYTVESRVGSLRLEEKYIKVDEKFYKVYWDDTQRTWKVYNISKKPNPPINPAIKRDKNGRWVARRDPVRPKQVKRKNIISLATNLEEVGSSIADINKQFGYSSARIYAIGIGKSLLDIVRPFLEVGINFGLGLGVGKLGIELPGLGPHLSGLPGTVVGDVANRLVDLGISKIPFNDSLPTSAPRNGFGTPSLVKEYTTAIAHQNTYPFGHATPNVWLPNASGSNTVEQSIDYVQNFTTHRAELARKIYHDTFILEAAINEMERRLLDSLSMKTRRDNLSGDIIIDFNDIAKNKFLTDLEKLPKVLNTDLRAPSWLKVGAMLNAENIKASAQAARENLYALRKTTYEIGYPIGAASKHWEENHPGTGMANIVYENAVKSPEFYALKAQIGDDASERFLKDILFKEDGVTPRKTDDLVSFDTEMSAIKKHLAAESAHLNMRKNINIITCE